jgi:hypothetical protein
MPYMLKTSPGRSIPALGRKRKGKFKEQRTVSKEQRANSRERNYTIILATFSAKD